MDITVFFSWQSDTTAATGRELIARAVGGAVASVAADASVPFKPSLDQDTRGVPGAPTMVEAILRKIDACSIFVADVSLTFERTTERKAPNPNVLIELGYALRRLGPERVLLVIDSATGRAEQLPFDLRGNRAIRYNSAAEDVEATETALAGEVEDNIRLILRTVGVPHDIAPPVSLDLEFSKENITSDLHEYRLHVTASNRGTALLRDWLVEVRFPQALLHPNRSYPIVQERSNDGRVVMRMDEQHHSGPIFPGHPKELLGIDYIMTHDLYGQRGKLFPMQVEAVLYAQGTRIASNARTVKDLQWF